MANQDGTATQELKQRRNVTKLRSFLDFCNVFQSFVFCFVRILAPLTLSFRKINLKSSINWTKRSLQQL